MSRKNNKIKRWAAATVVTVAAVVGIKVVGQEQVEHVFEVAQEAIEKTPFAQTDGGRWALGALRDARSALGFSGTKDVPITDKVDVVQNPFI